MASTITLKTNIPCPEDKHSSIRIYPFNEMEVGDSVEFDDTEMFHKARRAAAQYGKRNGVRFTTRKGIQDGSLQGQGGTIWRIK